MNECFQDAMPGDVCFGCGAENTHGLRIRSFWEGDEGYAALIDPGPFSRPFSLSLLAVAVKASVLGYVFEQSAMKLRCVGDLGHVFLALDLV